MSKTLIKNKTLIIFFSILLIGFFLRAYHFTTVPRLGATFDEFAWTWLGMSLIEKQVPSSWSNYDVHVGYREYKEYLDAKFWIITPYLEHPPLFGLVAGSFAYLNGATNLFNVELDTIRPLALVLGIISIIILFFLVREIYDEKIALLASLIYATVPTIVIGSRLVQNENFFIPFYLLCLFLIYKFIKGKDKRYFVIVAVICGLLTLAKIPWIAAGVGIGLILIYNKLYRYFIYLILIVLGIFSLFILYGAYFNWNLFLDVWMFQLARYELHFNSIYSLITQPYLADRFMIDGWIYFGWLAFVLLLINDFKKHYLLILGFLGYFLIYVFAIPDTPGHGWYRYPFYPFLVISIAFFIKEYFNKNYMLTFLFILFLGLSLLELSFMKQFGFSFIVFRVFIISTLIILLPLFFKSKKLANYSKLYSYIVLILLFGLNVWSVMEYVDL